MAISYNEWIDGNGCCTPVVGGCKPQNPCDCDNILLEISKLWTNDEILQEEIDELTSGTSITVDSELNLDSINPVQNKVITEALNDKLDASAYTPVSLSGYATEQWVIEQCFITGVNLSNYATKAALEQNINYLQEQINSLIASISGCCVSSGETKYRWITEVGENDYWCSGTTKMSMEKEQSSEDGLNWTDTGSERSGSTVLETNCTDCGYGGGYRFTSITTADTEVKIPCDCEQIGLCNELKAHEVAGYINGIENLKSMIVGDCITVIGNLAYANAVNLLSVKLPNTIEYLKTTVFDNCNSMQSLTIEATTPPTFYSQLGKNLFGYDEFGQTIIPDGFVIYVPSASVNDYKTASGWSEYTDIIQAIQ